MCFAEARGERLVESCVEFLDSELFIALLVPGERKQ